MALTSTLFTGLSGLSVNQTKLNVTGNNIANANTTAFKSSRALFTPEFYVTDSAGGPPTDNFGGSNPSQRGLGAQVAAIQKDFTQGSLETTGKSTDMAIDGEGFFIVQGSDTYYTRDGAFSLSPENKLVTTRGDFVMGYGTDESGAIQTGSLQQLIVPLDIKSQAEATENVTLQGNLDADGDLPTGASVLDSTALDTASGDPLATTTLLSDVAASGDTTPMFATGDVLTLAGQKGGRSLPDLTFTITDTSSVQDLLNFYNQGMVIDTSAEAIADAPAGYSPGATLDTTSGTIKLISNPGSQNALSLTGDALTSTNANMTMAFSDDAQSLTDGESIHTSFQVYDSLGTPVDVGVTAVLQSKDLDGTTWRFFAESPDNARARTFDPAATGANAFDGAILGTGTLKFDNDGKLVSTTGNTLTLDRNNTGATPNQSVKLNFESMTALSTRDSSLIMGEQDGFATGTLNGFSVGPNGIVTGTFSNGQTRQLGQVAIALFDNPTGLVDQGSNLFLPGSDSGTPTVSAPLEQSAGAIRAGSLELSNVDLSKEFINLIISSTGFSAASRVISTSDQLLNELLQTAR